MTNVGSIDRAVRYSAGFVLLLLSLFGGFFESWGAWGIVLGIVGLVLVGTAAARVCPAYLLLGIRTCAPGKP